MSDLQKAADELIDSISSPDNKERVSMWELQEKLKIIERLHYVVTDITLKENETLILLKLRDKIINSLV